MTAIMLSVTLLLLTGIITAESKYSHKHNEVSRRIRAAVLEDNAISRKQSSNSSIAHLCLPSWKHCSKTNCRNVTNHILRCTDNEELAIMEYHCITYSEIDDVYEVGKCMYNSASFSRSHNIFQTLNIRNKNVSMLNSLMCDQFNRTGTLCGKCKDGYHQHAYSFNMTYVKCQNGSSDWWKFLLAAFLPLTVFYFIVLLFQINVTSSHLHGFVLYSQVVSMPAMARYLIMNNIHEKKIEQACKYLGVVYSTWNLDMLRFLDFSICLETTTLQTLSLDLAISIYPFFLMLITYIMIKLYDRNLKMLVIIWKPFRAVLGLFRHNWKVKTSLVDAFATLLLLSNVKFLSVSFDLLAPVKVKLINSTGYLTHSWRLYFDATVPYFGERHLPYAILALTVLLLFVIFPFLLLTLYPFSCFHRLLNFFPFNWYILHTFMDTFQGCYKDGIEPGTRDCRWFAALFMFTRFSLFAICIGTLNTTYTIFASMLLIAIAIATYHIQPFKRDMNKMNDSNTVFLILITMWYSATLGFQYTFMFSTILTAALVVVILPLVYMSYNALCWI